MGLLFTLSLLPLWVAAGVAQTPSPTDFDDLALTADKLIRNEGVLRGVGHVKAKLGPLVIQADEATSNSETGELQLRGHVQATLPARADHSVFRYDSGTLVTDKPIALYADRLSVKNGLLQASKNIKVRPVDAESPDVPQLQADEMFMYLRIADATLRGNVRTNGMPSRRRSLGLFPPDIIK